MPVNSLNRCPMSQQTRPTFPTSVQLQPPSPAQRDAYLRLDPSQIKFFTPQGSYETMPGALPAPEETIVDTVWTGSESKSHD